jgi:hypothetical protein
VSPIAEADCTAVRAAEAEATTNVRLSISKIRPFYLTKSEPLYASFPLARALVFRIRRL